MAQNTFPVLTTEEICLCLGELGIPLSETQLQKPVPEQMQSVRRSRPRRGPQPFIGRISTSNHFHRLLRPRFPP